MTGTKQAMALIMLLGIFAPLAAQNLFVNYTSADGLVADDNKCLVIDNLGRVWIGAKSGGMAMYDGENFFQYTTVNSDLDGGAIRNIFIDSSNRLWICQSVAGISVLDSTVWTTYSPADGMPSENTFMATEHAGKFYVATDKGLGIFDGTNWTSYNEQDGLPESVLSYVFTDSDGILWLGNKTRAVSSGSPDSGWTTVDWTSDGEPTEVRVIGNDLDGNLWVGTRAEGVARYDGSQWRTFSKADGLGHNNVWGMAVDSTDRMWFATYGGGLSVFDGRNWDTYTNTDAGVDNTDWNWNTSVAVAADGSIWVATNAGVSRLPAENIRPLGKPCDINGDGRVNISDIISLLVIQRSSPMDTRTDHNGDGEVNGADIIELLSDIISGACAEQ